MFKSGLALTGIASLVSSQDLDCLTPPRASLCRPVAGITIAINYWWESEVSAALRSQAHMRSFHLRQLSSAAVAAELEHLPSVVRKVDFVDDEPINSSANIKATADNDYPHNRGGEMELEEHQQVFRGVGAGFSVGVEQPTPQSVSETQVLSHLSVRDLRALEWLMQQPAATCGAPSVASSSAIAVVKTAVEHRLKPHGLNRKNTFPRTSGLESTFQPQPKRKRLEHAIDDVAGGGSTPAAFGTDRHEFRRPHVELLSNVAGVEAAAAANVSLLEAAALMQRKTCGKRESLQAGSGRNNRSASPPCDAFPNDLGFQDALASLLASLDCRAAINVLYALALLEPRALKALMDDIRPVAAHLLITTFENADEWMEHSTDPGPLPSNEVAEAVDAHAYQAGQASVLEDSHRLHSASETFTVHPSNSASVSGSAVDVADTVSRAFQSKHDFYTAVYGVLDDPQHFMQHALAQKDILGRHVHTELLKSLLL